VGFPQRLRMGAAARLAEVIPGDKPVDGLTISALVKKGWSGLTNDDEVKCVANTVSDRGAR
jgi:hypothetical protein